ncbi:MAG: sugar phosphate nucleotidyltransferase [Candidatus Pacearchaeota archaeon]
MSGIESCPQNKMNILAIILAGGMGKRLGLSIPKVLVGLNGKTLLDYQIQWLNSFGITNIVVAIGYKHNQIIKHIKNKGYKNIKFSIEKEHLGTAGGLKKAFIKIANNTAIVVNVDDITDVNINKLIKYDTGTICIRKMNCPSGIVHTKGNKIIKFEEKPLLKNIWISVRCIILIKK